MTGHRGTGQGFNFGRGQKAKELKAKLKALKAHNIKTGKIKPDDDNNDKQR